MPDRRDPPPTDEGWYTLHEFRTIDWDAWREAPERERERALDEAIDFLQSALAVEDADEGASAIYSILGHKADFLLLHMRPSTAHTGALERRFEQTDFARFTERTTSFVSVTEASGYSERARDYFTGDLDEDSGLYNYIQTRLKPDIPDATHVCFYPMDKRRTPEQNWYDLPFEERAEHMDAHGDIGRDYGGKVKQMITGAIALDDWEWGVTLWGEDFTDMKDLLYEMRFDPSTSQFAEFGSFYVGRRFPPEDLPALLAGDPVPSDGTEGTVADAGPVHPADADHAHGDDPDHGHTEADAGHDHGESAHGAAESRGSAHPGSPAEGDHPHGDEESDGEDIDDLLATLGFHAGEDYDGGDYGLVLYSDAETQDLAAELDGLRENFEHYDSHVTSAVRAHGERAVVVSIWDNEGAADTAHGFLTDLPGVTDTVQGDLGGAEDHPDGGAEDHPDADRDHDETDDDHPDAGGGGRPDTSVDDDHPVEERGPEEMAGLLGTLGLHADEEYSPGDHALVLYSDADADDLNEEVDGLRGNFDHYDSHTTTVVRAHQGRSAVVSIWDNEGAADTAHGFLTDLPGVTETVRGDTEGGDDSGHAGGDDESDAESIREELADLDVYAGKPHGEDIYALVLYSRADREDLLAEVSDLRDGFDRYDTHEGTDIYADPNSDTHAVVSLWETQDAADTASEYLTDLPDIAGWAGEGDGFGTMGMFYTVKPEHREDFVEKFDTVGGLLADMDGHRETSLLANVDDENDMFIASQWDSKDDAMAFFRSDAFTDTVDWGRDVLADKPRHVFLA
jgi:chlorite dismutase